ncbi:SIR2 family NAD-dependent protein deacylase [Paenarthrobacter sp. NPDC090520]|uniref:SIR2 family NAD-dependent protein deacylase n=1 Tax=Paenarthrobacter sp. NPDC090520 TaxID=3364382 RepID=UPI00381F8C8F
MPYLRDVITTNWDTYFEEECQATPFVTGEDISLYRMPGRRVFKIHGSMNNLASIVATETDYAKRLEDLSVNVLGGLLKQLLATKTIVFIGYSLRNWNFRRLYQALLDDMKDYAPRAYMVSPFDLEKQDDLGLRHIKTSGIHFLRELKSPMSGHCFLPDDGYERLETLQEEVFDADEVTKSVDHKDFPAVMYSWAYHDGMKDACFRVARRRGSGEYSDRHHVHSLAASYDKLGERAYAEERFLDAAYIEGYLNCLLVLLDDENKYLQMIPRYFVYGSDEDVMTPEEFHQALVHSRRRAPRERAKAKKISAELPAGMVFTHELIVPDVQSAEW